ncbi:MAG TPA: tetratricopeptide repeat protein [Caulobacteraceae bacterium]|nr:tetratricopeptide repeat protein [Caulobacteraceae bacterium]
MIQPLPSSLQVLQSAARLLQAGRPGEALPLLRNLTTAAPTSPDAHRLLGLALRDLGDTNGAEATLRAAHRLAPGSAPTAYALCELLRAAGRSEEALAVIAPLADRPDADLHLLTAKGEALKALDHLGEAETAFSRAAAVAPASAVAEHNLGAVLGDLERFGESEAAARRALAKGGDAPETWLVLARALLGQGRNAEAEGAYRAVIAGRPDDVEAQGELAQLIWMLTDDVAVASVELDAAIARFPANLGLRLKKGFLLQTGGDLDAAYGAVEGVLDRAEAEPMMHVIAARFSLWRHPQRALRHARDGVALLPNDPVAQSTLAEAYLATGDPAAALRIAERMHAAAPLDQQALGTLATCWRLLDDPRYGRLYDYDHFVRTWRIDTPEGWPDLEAFLADLKVALERRHTLRTHPVGQSVRHGSQTSQRLTVVDDPVIKAFFKAVDGPIRRHIEALGAGEDPLRSRRTGGYEFNGEWSVRLRESGYHAGHLHPRGWLSSACYISLPSAVERDGHEGWLQFGEPGVPTSPALPAEHFIKPEPGLLALFPSYMWHGTVPFSGDEARLTIAFDVIPA